MNYDLAILGNGILGTLTAIQFKRKYPKYSIIMIGNYNRPYSASVGAGAMANVYAEIEKGPFKDINEARFLKIGLSARSKWLKILDELKIKNKAITAKDTVVFLKKNPSEFEAQNYLNMKEASNFDKKSSLLSRLKIKNIFPNTHINIEEATLLKGEFSICTIALFMALEKNLRSLGIPLINKNVKNVKIISDNKIKIFLSDGNKIINAKKIVVAAGSSSANFFDNEVKIIPMLQGVGSAIILNNSKLLPKSFNKYVIRTVNRGGAQCGLHTVPRSDETLYLGAGNYVTKPSFANHRLETVRYLYDLFGKELVGKQAAYPLIGSLSLGYRPRTIDGFPCIGQHTKYQNIFFATGTNRVGLTWAPEITNQVLNWFSEKKISDDFVGWNPDRNIISFGNKIDCINYFIESRLSAGLEHNNFTLGQSHKIKSNLKKIANSQYNKIKKIYPEANVNPDNWQVLLEY